MEKETVNSIKSAYEINVSGLIAEHKNWFGAENTRILYKIG
jgi:hypothetical protein